MDKGSLEKKSLNDLRYIAKMMNIKSPTKYKKDELVEIIVNSEAVPVDEKKETVEPSAEKKEKVVTQKKKTKKSEVKNVADEAVPENQKKKDLTEGEVASDKSQKDDNIDEKVTSDKKEKKPGAKKYGNNRSKNHTKRTNSGRKKTAGVAEDDGTSSEVSEMVEGAALETSAIEAEKIKASVDVVTEVISEIDADAEVKSENTTGDESVDEKAEEVQLATEHETKPYNDNTGKEAAGILDILQEGYGFLRSENFVAGSKDTYVPPQLIRKYGLKTGDFLVGKCRYQKENDTKNQALMWINTINGYSVSVHPRRRPFESLTPIYPDEKLVLEVDKNELSTRLIDLIAPIGKGQRGMIVSPPKAGKTVLLKKIANSITANYPDVELIVLLIDERPEEVTDMRESVNGTVVSSTFDELPERHIKVSELVLERAQRLVEYGKDVVILMDSITRLARAYNLTIPPTGRSLSGGLDPGALHKPKKFFGAARNIRGGGSLTIVATALVDTGSKLDDVIFEEFKGTGNMELHLDRKLSEKRIFPAIDINKSGTRKEELLLTERQLNVIFNIRRAMSNLGTADVTEILVNQLTKTKDNEEFISSVKFNEKV